MAALLLPLAFAGAGYLGFGTTGAAVGWLIGSWLFGPKATTENQIFDPGAQEMPRFNQSLRGITMPVFFGTNRVASNTVWVNNFQTIRKETSTPQQGGGKGGGSGMGGKGGGQATNTQVSYEYKWDMLFHMGMGPEPYGLFGGWVNTQRMSGDTVLAIINGQVGLPPISSSDPRSVTFSITSPGGQQTQTNNTASLTFDDCFFGPGGATGDTSYPAWDYFESVVGQPVRWPFTYYVGFKGLSLGSSPAVPQLSFEIGPGTASLTRNPTFLGHNTNDTWQGTSNCVMVDPTGNHWIAINGVDYDADDLVLWCFETGAIIHKVATTDLPAPVASSAVTSALVFPTANSPYVLHVGIGFAGGPDVELMARLYKLNATGGLDIIYDTVFVQANGQGDALSISSMHGFGFMSFDHIMSQESGYLSWIIHRGGPGNSKIVLMTLKYQGGVDKAESQYPIPDDDNMHGTTNLLFYDITDGVTSENILVQPGGMDTDQNSQRAFFLPEYHPENTVVNGKWPITYWLCVYVSKAMIAAYTSGSAVMDTNNALFPNGYIVGWQITGNVFPGLISNLTISDATILNDRFLGENGTPLPALFSDSGKDLDGGANQKSEYLGPSVQAIQSGASAGGCILVFPKVFNKIADQGDAGSYLKLQVFAWNPSEMSARFYTQSEGAWFDAGTIGGVGGVNGNTPQHIATFYDLDAGLLYVCGNFGASAAVGPDTVASIWGPLQIGGGEDVLPPYIIYQVLTNPVFGMGISEDDIDQGSYSDALLYCDSQGFRVSVQYTREQDILSVIEDLLALYGGYLIDSGGKVRFGVATADSSLAPVRVIDNDHLVPPKEGDPPVKVTKGASQDGYNKVRINYFDRDLDYRQNQYEVGDEVDQDLNGVRFKEFPPQYVMGLAMAQAVGERALWTNLYARDTYSFKLGWKDADLEPGDVVTLVDSFHPELSVGVNVRIAHWQEKTKGQFDVMAVREVPYYMTASHDTTNTNTAGLPKGQSDEVLPCSDFRMYELPREFQTSGGYLFVGYNQQSNIRGATLWLSPDGVSYTPATNAEPYNISGMFARPLPALSPGQVDTDVEMWIMPASGFNPATPTFCQTLALDDVTAAARSAGAGVLICGSEALAMETLTLLGQNHYRIKRLYRGWGGTMPQAHSSGALWHKHGGGIFLQETSPDKIGTHLWYKVSPYNFAGVAYDISSIEGKEYVIRGGYWLPQIQNTMRISVSTPLDGQSSLDLRGDYFHGVQSGGCNVTIEWPDAARLAGFGASGFGAGGFGDFLADADTHFWRVEVMRSDIVVRSTSVSTPSYTYLREVNSEDFAGFSAEVQFRVTPYNHYGDAPYSMVRSIHTFSGGLAPHGFLWSATSVSFDSTSFTWDQR